MGGVDLSTEHPTPWAKVLSLHASAVRGFPRQGVEQLRLIEGFGVEGDRKAGKRENRAVLLVGQDSYDHLAGLGLHLPHGGLGENIVLDSNPHTLEAGSLLSIGEAVLEISLYCTPCKTLRDRYGPDFPALLGRRRGMLARVLKGGEVWPGQEVGLNLHITARSNEPVAINP